MTIDDAAHFSDVERARIIASYPAHELEARTKGVPTLGSGRICQGSLVIYHQETDVRSDGVFIR